MRKTVIAFCVVLATGTGASAAPSIDVGTHYLQPDTPGQTVSLYVTGGDAVQGLELNVQIGGGTTGPTFDGDPDIISGTIFQDNNDGLTAGTFVDPRVLYTGTVTQAGTVAADGLLATLSVSTAGMTEGAYALSLLDSPEGVTDFAGLSGDITDGWLVIVPEPATMLLMTAGAALLRRRRM